MRRTAVILLVALLLASCMNTFAAEGDARRAVESGDYRLMAVQGFSTETPGVDRGIEWRYGYRVVKGTGDYWVWPWDASFNVSASEYAERYNRVIVEHAPK